LNQKDSIWNLLKDKCPCICRYTRIKNMYTYIHIYISKNKYNVSAYLGRIRACFETPFQFRSSHCDQAVISRNPNLLLTAH
jgi:hypothetical protein